MTTPATHNNHRTYLLLELTADVAHTADYDLQSGTFRSSKQMQFICDEQSHILKKEEKKKQYTVTCTYTRIIEGRRFRVKECTSTTKYQHVWMTSLPPSPIPPPAVAGILWERTGSTVTIDIMTTIVIVIST